MEKNKLILLCDNTHDLVGLFYKHYSKENINSTPLNWNAKDVLGHILFWMDHCGKKIYSIKKNIPFEIVDAYKKNDETYLKNKHINMEKLLEDINNVLFNCKNVIDMYTENELLVKTFPTGFEFEMWRYIVMDMYIHPIMHLLHYYMKIENYDEFIKTINLTYKDFMEYANDDINVYNFNNFFEDLNKKREEFQKIKSINDKILKKIIEINIT